MLNRESVANMSNEQIVKEIEAIWHTEHNGDLYCIKPLMFHVALLVNPKPLGGYEDRYCYHNPTLAILAVAELVASGELKYWKKHHTKNISVVGKYAYPPGVYQSPENALYEVSWDADQLEREFPYRPLL